MSEYNSRQWDLVLEHPDGWTRKASYSGDGCNVVLQLADLMARSENEFKQGRARGDRPAQPMADRNVRVDEFGQSLNADIRSRW